MFVVLQISKAGLQMSPMIFYVKHCVVKNI